MKQITASIKDIIVDQFPELYREEGDDLVSFVEAYFEWAETELDGNNHEQAVYLARDMFNERDLDDPDREYEPDIILHFRKKYLNNIPRMRDVDDNFLVRHIQDIYKSKGSQQAVEVLMRTLFNTESTVKYPGEYVIRPSSSEFITPVYLELEVYPDNYQLINKYITGSTSGATAFIETMSTQKGKKAAQFDVAFLSDVRGNFITGERLIDADGSSYERPTVVGSLTSLDIINGGANYNVGDVFDIVSEYGVRGKARVDAVVDDTGRVEFTLVDGGSGYTLSTVETEAGLPVTSVIISNNVIVADGANTAAISRFQKVVFPYIEAELTAGEPLSDYDYGSNVVFYNVSETEIGEGIIVAKDSTPNTLIIAVSNAETTATIASGASKLISFGNNSVNSAITCTDVTVTANVTGSNTTTFGIHDKGANTVYANNSYFINYYANGDINQTGTVNAISTGTGATFDIGSLTNTERVAIFTDLLAGENEYTTLYIDPTSTVAGFTGQNDTLSIGINGIAPSGETSNTIFQDVVIVNGGSGYLDTDTVVVDNNKYANGSAISGHSAGSGLSIDITSVDANGVITGVSLISGGSGYTYLPEITITTAGGSSAELLPVQGYGFPKLPSGNFDTIISECLDVLNADIGTITTLKGINPGDDYNYNPYVVVINKYIAAYDRKDLIVELDSLTDLFVVGEVVSQVLTVTAPTITVGNLVSNTETFLVGEGVTQVGNESARGQVLQWNPTTGTLIFELTAGTFSTNNNVKGVTSGAIYETSLINVSSTYDKEGKGIIRTVTQDLDTGLATLTLKRISFNTGFALGSVSGAALLIGETSAATGDVISVIQDPSSGTMGDNADVTAVVVQADNIASSISIIDSGIGFVNGEQVTLEIASNPVVITANTVVSSQGRQEGYWRTNRHFTSEVNSKIHDSYYYQDYSYVIKSDASYANYEQVLKDVLHVAGTKPFGETTIKVADDVAMTSEIGDKRFKFTANTDSLTDVGANTIVLVSGDTSKFSQRFDDGFTINVKGSYATTYKSDTLATANSGANTFIVDNIANLFTGLTCTSDDVAAFPGSTTITAINTTSNSISISNNLLLQMPTGTTVKFTGSNGKLGSNTIITDINTNTITINKTTVGTIPAGTTLIFEGIVPDANNIANNAVTA